MQISKKGQTEDITDLVISIVLIVIGTYIFSLATSIEQMQTQAETSKYLLTAREVDPILFLRSQPLPDGTPEEQALTFSDLIILSKEKEDYKAALKVALNKFMMNVKTKECVDITITYPSGEMIFVVKQPTDSKYMPECAVRIKDTIQIPSIHTDDITLDFSFGSFVELMNEPSGMA